MKKILYTIMLFLVCIGITNAAKCNVVSGTGKNIGDEIACGTEHFYVIPNDGTNVKMLAKYNLLVGMSYSKIQIENKIYETPQEFYNISVLKEKLNQGYYIYDDYETEEYLEYILKKEIGYDNKTLIFEDKNITFHEYLNSKEVKELFADGYELENAYHYNEECLDNQACKYKYYGGAFSKSIYYENKIIIFDEPIDSRTQSIEEYIEYHEEYQNYINKGYELYEYYYDTYTYVEDTTSTTYKLYSGVSLYIEDENYKEKVYQDETAIGAHGDEKGNPIPEEIGITEPMYMIGEIDENAYSTYFYDITYYGDEGAYYYIDAYNYTLESEGFNIVDINTLTVGELNELVKSITSKELPLAEWYENATETKYNQMTGSDYLVLGSIKESIPSEYSWLWGTTYWLRTTDESYNLFFVDTLGELCSMYYCQPAVGAGIRPVVTISAKDLVYSVTTKTDGNGTIESTHVHAEKGEIIKFVITPNEGYVLSEVKVTDEEGNVITFTENTFTMPEANVIIEATFTVENSETSTSNIIIAIIFLIISCTIFYKFKKKANWLEV